LIRSIWTERLWAFAGAVSIRTKIFGIILGMVLLLGTAITLQVRLAVAAHMTGQLEDQSISVARDLAARSTDLVLLNDLFALHQLLAETQANNANVRYALVLDEEGQLLAHTFGSAFPLDLLAHNAVAGSEHHNTILLETEEGLIWDTAVPMLEGRVGSARVGLSDRSLRQAEGFITTQLLISTVLVSLVGMSAAAFLTWIISRPIISLVEATQAVASGNFSAQVRRWANDEIGELADSFNRMTAELSRLDDLRREREVLRRQLLERVITTQEEERKRIARELHDSTSQNLTSLLVGLKILESACCETDIQQQVRELRGAAAQSLEEVHSLATLLRPSVLDDLGLAAALQRLVGDWQARHKIPVDLLIHTGDLRLPGAVETTLYRIVQETLTNIARHAQARSISVLLEKRADQVAVIVEDDGVGFDLSATQNSSRLGLVGINERAELLGGRMTIESSPGRGTSIFVEIPLPEEPRKSDAKEVSEGWRQPEYS
jgi:signal transduction histidine kinase